MFSRNDFSIWSILRKCIGMELSKITMPVIFNEPLSFLQRLTEYMEHTYLIHKASSFSDPVERMQCVAAFAVSAVASQWERTGKPFNPLLGETYELVRDDLGFRLISEQVSHHPPISAFHAEGLNNDFIFHGSIYPKLKFWGKSVEAEPKGTITLELLETGDKCVLNFKPCGLFGKELHKVEGYIQDKSKKKLCALYGKWTECLYSVDLATFDAYKKNDKKNTEEKKNSKQMSTSEESDEMPMPDSESVFVIPGSVLLWRIAPRPPNSAQIKLVKKKSDWRKNKEQPAKTGPSQKRTGRRGGSIKVLIPTTEHRTGFTRAATGTETTSICLTFIKMQTSQGGWLIYK
ncbi:oxysterol-binding protein-related protein 1 [Trichechus manatus latirostris]|uniref:Oxysterol-binding protein n=1 Tax=Trichechus manatus latirostris TaxID=127582 RepID=A0A2Y9S0J6_TRIMA|nr:oxysterol-binding protein-related protein 1 [Trichechus manatus latirostris]